MPIYVAIIRNGIIRNVELIARAVEVPAIQTRYFTPHTFADIRQRMRDLQAATGDTWDCMPLPNGQVPCDPGTPVNVLLRWGTNRPRRIRLLRGDWPDTGDGAGRFEIVHPDQDTE